jgi:hypothetical protein
MKPPIFIRTPEEMIRIFGQPIRTLRDTDFGYKLSIVRVKRPKAKMVANRRVGKS